MTTFEEEHRDLKRHRIEAFRPFGLIKRQGTPLLWAPAFIKDKWRILEVYLHVAKGGAANVFQLAGDANNIVSFVSAAMKRKARDTPPRSGVMAWVLALLPLVG